MPTKKEVYWAADRLQMKGDRVSLRKVIPLLPYGGSNREVGPYLRDWKVERAYRPALESKDLPERLQRQLAKATARLWTVAQLEAAKLLEGEREALAAEKRAGDTILDEALARLDAAEAEAAQLRDLLARLEHLMPRDRTPATAPMADMR